METKFTSSKPLFMYIFHMSHSIAICIKWSCKLVISGRIRVFVNIYTKDTYMHIRRLKKCVRNTSTRSHLQWNVIFDSYKHIGVPMFAQTNKQQQICMYAFLARKNLFGKLHFVVHVVMLLIMAQQQDTRISTICDSFLNF